MLGMARSDAKISTGWCVGPFLPMPISTQYGRTFCVIRASHEQAKKYVLYAATLENYLAN
jgi:hypothetical protein